MSKTKPSQQLKALYTRRREVTRSIAIASTDAERDQTRFRQLCDELSALNTGIERLRTREVIVTEHALLRYLQRVYGLDLDALTAEILTPQLQSQVLALGDGRYPITGGARAQIVNNMVVTILE